MNVSTDQNEISVSARKVVAALLSCTLALGSLSLVACGGSSQEQDNCYGEDMPVVNE
jgi:hypothetical protein